MILTEAAITAPYRLTGMCHSVPVSHHMQVLIIHVISFQNN